ncbi:MAG: outer membrane beta-barrel protein [Candidatus Aminicenantes bacterium]
MKKAAVVFWILILVPSLHADFKITGGLNLSSYTGEKNTTWKKKMGLLGGLGVEFDLTYRTLLEVDILFFQKGSLTGSTIKEEKYVLYTASVPVLLRSKLFHGTSPYIAGGLEFSGIIANIKKSEQEEPVDISDTMKRFDYGFVLGGGFEMKLKEQLFLFIEARYHLGIRNLLILPEEGLIRKTTAFVVLIGVRS